MHCAHQFSGSLRQFQVFNVDQGCCAPYNLDNGRLHCLELPCAPKENPVHLTATGLETPKRSKKITYCISCLERTPKHPKLLVAHDFPHSLMDIWVILWGIDGSFYRSQTSDSRTDERREEKRREEKRGEEKRRRKKIVRERVRRKKVQEREQVAKSRIIVFF